MKKINKTKEEKGSITLFVLMSMIFFVIVLVGLYVNSSYKVQKQQKEIERIQRTYEIEDINGVYNRAISTFQSNINEKTLS